MAYFLIQPGQTLVSTVDARRFTADENGIVKVDNDLQAEFHNMGATLWIDPSAPVEPEAEAPAVVVSDPVEKPAKPPKVKAPVEAAKGKA